VQTQVLQSATHACGWPADSMVALQLGISLNFSVCRGWAHRHVAMVPQIVETQAADALDVVVLHAHLWALSHRWP
jgi:hypothetical protein